MVSKQVGRETGEPLSGEAAAARDRLQLEREKFEAEQKARDREIALKEAESLRSRKWDPLVIAIFAAAVAAAGNMGVSFLNGRSSAHIESLKAEQALILEAIKTGGDAEKTIANLRLLAETGMLPSREARLSKYLRELKPEDAPGLPAAYRGAPEVVSLQKCLNALGIGTPADGIFGARTRAQLKQVQLEHGLEDTGVLDEPTKAKLNALCNSGKTNP